MSTTGFLNTEVDTNRNLRENQIIFSPAVFQTSTLGKASVGCVWKDQGKASQISTKIKRVLVVGGYLPYRLYNMTFWSLLLVLSLVAIESEIIHICRHFLDHVFIHSTNIYCIPTLCQAWSYKVMVYRSERANSYFKRAYEIVPSLLLIIINRYKSKSYAVYFLVLVYNQKQRKIFT